MRKIMLVISFVFITLIGVSINASAGTTYTHTATTQSDFQAGTSTNLTATSSGDLQLITTLPITADTYVSQGGNFANDEVNVNYNSAANVQICDYNGYLSNSLFKIDVSSIPPGTTINSAKVRLYGYYRQGSQVGFGATVHRITASWNEATVTWNTQPTVSTSYGSTVNLQTGWFEFDITQIVQEWVNGTYPNYGVELKTTADVSGVDEWNALSSNTTLTPFRPVVQVNIAPGVFTSPTLDISTVGTAKTSKISWNVTTPTNTTFTLETNLSTDGGSTWGGWQTAANGGTISGVSNGTDLSSGRLKYRATFATTDITVTPQLNKIDISITPSNTYYYRDTAQSDFAAGTLSNVTATKSSDLTLTDGGFVENFDTLGGDWVLSQYSTGTGATAGISYSRVAVTNFGSGVSDHGPVLTKTLTSPLNDFDITFSGVNVGNSAGSMGYFGIYLLDASDNAMYLWDYNDGWALDASDGSVRSAWFEGNNARYAISATTYNNDVRIARNGTTIDFYNGTNKVYTGTALSTTAVAKIRIVFTQYSTYTAKTFSIDGITLTNYSTSGTITSPIINLTSAGTAASSQISWSKTTPTNTTITVDTNLSTDGGTTWGGWQSATNGGVISGITNGTNLSNGRLKCRVNLSTTDVLATPLLNNIAITIASVTSAPAPGTPTGTDVANYGDGRDIRVTFNGSSDETNISGYRIFVVPSAGTLNQSTASGLAAQRYVAEAKSGANGAHTVTLTQGLKDSTGASIANGSAYKVYVLAVAQNGLTDALSSVSSNFSLLIGSAPAVSQPLASDAANNGDGRDVKVVFRGANNEVNISGYRIYVVPSASAGSFNATTASGLGSGMYVTEGVSGPKVVHTVSLTQGLQDSSGAGVTTGTAYKAFVLAVGQGGYGDSLSPASQTFTLVGSTSGSTTILSQIAAPKAYDIANHGDGSDIKLTFRSLYNEDNVSVYRIIVVPSASEGTFDLTAANGVIAARYYSVSKTGPRKTRTVTLPNTLLDSGGAGIANGTAYRVFVLAVATSGSSDNTLSPQSPAITLSATVPSVSSVTRLSAADITNNNDASDIQVKFTALSNETNVQEYRIFVVPSASAGSFNLTTANGNTHYYTEAKTTARAQHIVTLDPTLVDSTGGTIANSNTYKVFVLTVGQNTYANRLSIGTDVALN